MSLSTAAGLLQGLVVAQALLPEGFEMPSFVYVVVLVVGTATVAALLWALKPPVTDATVLALAPWMMIGGTVHALYQIHGAPDLVEPLLGTPAIYVTTAIVGGSVWIVTSLYSAMGSNSPDRPLGLAGIALFTVALGWGVVQALGAGTLDPLPVVIGIVAATLLTALTWFLIGYRWTQAAAVTSWTGALVVASHALDGVSTAVGFDWLDAEERTPLSAYVLDAAEALPTAEYVGSGWLFVAVKLALATVVVVLFRDWVREAPRQARLVLAFVAAVGLGPAVHNFTLFLLAG